MGLKKGMNENMEYKETIRAVSDKIVADIYQLKSNKVYMIKICDISQGEKRLIITKLRYERDGYDYQMIKNEISEYLFKEAYLKLHPLDE